MDANDGLPINVDARPMESAATEAGAVVDTEEPDPARARAAATSTPASAACASTTKPLDVDDTVVRASRRCPSGISAAPMTLPPRERVCDRESPTMLPCMLLMKLLLCECSRICAAMPGIIVGFSLACRIASTVSSSGELPMALPAASAASAAAMTASAGESNATRGLPISSSLLVSMDRPLRPWWWWWWWW